MSGMPPLDSFQIIYCLLTHILIIFSQKTTRAQEGSAAEAAGASSKLGG